jgi:hypothetical protein
VRVILRAVAFCQLAKGATAPRISSIIPLNSTSDFAKSAIAASKESSNAHSMRRSDPELRKCSMTNRSNASSRWSAVTRPRVAPAEPCGWWWRSRQAAIGSTRGKGNYPRSAPPPRPQAVAGKNVVCGRTLTWCVADLTITRLFSGGQRIAQAPDFAA